MSTKSKKISVKGKRYTPAEKQEVVDYVNQVNAQNGRGGQSSAAKKFGVSVLTVSAWLKAAGVAKVAKVVEAPKAAAPVKAAKTAAPVKAAKAVKAPKAAKAVKAPKAAKAVKAPKAAAKKAADKVPQGTRYTDEQKKAVLDYVASVNATNGRGGMSAAARKFKITPLTIGVWVRKYGIAGGTVTKAAKVAAAPAGVSAKVVAKLLAQVAKAEATIGKVKTLLASL